MTVVLGLRSGKSERGLRMWVSLHGSRSSLTAIVAGDLAS